MVDAAVVKCCGQLAMWVTSRDTAVVKETESVPGMLLISPQAVMFEPTGYQSASADDDTSTTTTTTSCDEGAAQHDCIIVPMDSISSIMISHDCAAAADSTGSLTVLVYIMLYIMIDKVWILCRLLFVCLFVCFVILCLYGYGFLRRGQWVKFCTAVYQCPGQGIFHFGELFSPSRSKSDE